MSDDRFKRKVRASVTSDECGGSFAKMLRKFRFRVGRAGILADVKRCEAYVKPSARRRAKGMYDGGD